MGKLGTLFKLSVILILALSTFALYMAVADKSRPENPVRDSQTTGDQIANRTAGSQIALDIFLIAKAVKTVNMSVTTIEHQGDCGYRREYYVSVSETSSIMALCGGEGKLTVCRVYEHLAEAWSD